MTLLEICILILGILVCGMGSIWLCYDLLKSIKKYEQQYSQAEKEQCPSKEEVEE